MAFAGVGLGLRATANDNIHETGKRSDRCWTPKEDQQLLDFFDAEASWPLIAIALDQGEKMYKNGPETPAPNRDRSEGARNLRASKPAARAWTSGEEIKFRDMLDAGKAADEIAVELNRTRLAVYSRLQRLYRMRPIRDITKP
jgi:hypothetical protein